MEITSKLSSTETWQRISPGCCTLMTTSSRVKNCDSSRNISWSQRLFRILFDVTSPVNLDPRNTIGQISLPSQTKLLFNLMTPIRPWLFQSWWDFLWMLKDLIGIRSIFKSHFFQKHFSNLFLVVLNWNFVSRLGISQPVPAPTQTTPFFRKP